MTEAQRRAFTTLMPAYGLRAEDLSQLGPLRGRPAPVHLEIGIGNGDNLVAMAARQEHFYSA